MKKTLIGLAAVAGMLVPMAMSAAPALADQQGCGAVHAADANVNGNFGFLGQLGGTPGYHNGATGQDPGATGYNNSHTGCQGT